MHLTCSDFIEEFLRLDAGFKICLFKDNKHKNTAPAHFHFIIPLNTGRNLVVCIVTSQIERQSEYYEYDRKYLNSMIPVDETNFHFLDRQSVVECNQAEYLTVSELHKRIDFNHGDGFQV